MTALYEKNVVEPTYFTVTFQDWDGTMLKTEQVEQGKSATAPADPTREGYTFKGWDKDFSDVQSDLTVTALYEQNVVEPTYFTVTFQDWDGTVLKTEQVEQGRSATAPADPTREGYTFKGWDKDFSNVQSDLTVTAQYTRDIVYYTVSFYDWDGTELHVEQVEQGKDAVGPAVNPTREGYTFVGWSKPITNIQSNLIVIAQYKENAVYFTVNFIDWDGTLLKSEEVEKGKSATAPADPTREGYTFKGWDKDFSDVQSDLTVTALYEQNVVEPPTPDESITVRLDPQSCSGWSSVYLYAWDANINQPAGEWPGTKVGKDGQGWWSYTFDRQFTNVNIIWTNGTGEQTIDITNVTQSTCYELDLSAYPYGVYVVDCSKDVTALEDVQINNKAQARKIIVNNTMYILMPDGKTYTIMGQNVK